MLGPGREISKFAIVSIVRHPHLRANQENLRIVYDDPAVVSHALVNDGPGEGKPISDHAFG